MKLTSSLLVPIVVTIALLFAAQSAQAAVMPTGTQVESFGLIPPGSHTAAMDLPDSVPNVAWFQFELDAVANVTLDTFGSDVDVGEPVACTELTVDFACTVLALYNPAGTLLGQNYDCPASSWVSCLFFSALEPASYLAGVVEYNAFFVLGTGPGAGLKYVEFKDMWELDNGNPSDDHSVTLNILVEAVSPTVVPVPAAFWLFGTALIGFIGFSRRTTV